MGYETCLYVGKLSPNEKQPHYFLKIATLALGKVGELIPEATSKENPKKYQRVMWSELIKIEREKVLKTFKEKNAKLVEKIGKGFDNLSAKLFDISEDWESEIHQDCYGSQLRAIPIDETINAIKAANDKCVAEEGRSYTRFILALALLKSLCKEYSKNSSDLFCIFYGY